MKKILFILAIMLSSSTIFAQGAKAIRKHRRLLARSEFMAEVKISDFLVHPDDYLPSACNPADINYIEFVRDTNYNNTRPVYASISEKDGFNNVYSIGPVLNYQRSETELSFRIRVYMKDGSVDSKQILFDFSNGVTNKNYDYKEADYDVDGEPFWDEWDGIRIVAL